MPTIHKRIESKRGCGYRKPGGIYLVCDGAGKECGVLPLELKVCPCCNAGIKQSRGYSWISTKIFGDTSCSFEEGSEKCADCPMGILLASDTKMGLLWVGEKFYKTPGDFSREAEAMGISRRIPMVPRDFVVGQTWVGLAHKSACDGVDEDGKPAKVPGVFRMFKPQRIEYIVTGRETLEELERLEERGFTLVAVEKTGTNIITI